MEGDPLLERLREICLALPETAETITWGHPNFRVRKKIFASYYREGRTASMSFKSTVLMQEHLVATDPRFSVAAYVGQHGWVTFRLKGKIDWDLVREHLLESFRLIAPKSLWKQVAGSPPD